MILKVSRPLEPIGAPFTVRDQTGNINFETQSVPYRVGVSCTWRASYWTAFFKSSDNIEFMRQVEEQDW